MDVKTSVINGEDVVKEMSVVQGAPWSYQDVSEGTQKGPVIPKLLTALLSTKEETGMTQVFQYDATVDTAQLPSGKAYSMRGKDLPKDAAKMKYFSIPSFGLRANVAPHDYVNRRKPFSTELMDEGYLIAKMTEKVDKAYMLNDELAYAQLLTLDTNRVAGGPFTVYNYYTDIMGTSRPAAANMDLDTSATDHTLLFRNEKKELLTTLAHYGDSASKIIVICGDTFFNQRLDIEKKESFGRELRSQHDFASMEVLMSSFGSGAFQYDWFSGDTDGLIYINYGAEIITGTKLIADTAGYMIPVGVGNFMGITYAPAQTRTYANTEALKRYSWAKEDEFQGWTMFSEENKLFWNKKPDLVRVLVNT